MERARPLQPAELTRFLRALARRIQHPARIVLTGGCEAMILGGTRPTGDLLRRERVSPLRLARLCGESLRGSPRSTQLLAFRRHVEHFFEAHGPFVWGGQFSAQRAIGAFHRAANIDRR